LIKVGAGQRQQLGLAAGKERIAPEHHSRTGWEYTWLW
jgi:hypothetical protein